MNILLRVKPVIPQLTVDKRLGDGGGQWIKFGVWANRPREHESYTRQITLTNRLAAALTFTVATTGPFQLTSCTTNAPKHPLGAPSAGMSVAGGAGGGDSLYRPSSRGSAPQLFTLTTQTNLVVEVSFDPRHPDAVPLSSSLFGSTATAIAAAAGATGGAGGTVSLPAASPTAGDGEAQAGSKLREEYTGTLTLTFANDHVQVCVCAFVCLPVLSLYAVSRGCALAARPSSSF